MEILMSLTQGLWQRLEDHINAQKTLTKGQKKQVLAQLEHHREKDYPDEGWKTIKEELDLALPQLQVRMHVMRPEVMTSKFLAQYLKKNAHLYKGKRVLDMGCGCGIQGLVMAANGANEVYFTDRLPEAYENTMRNIDLLCKEPPGNLGHATLHVLEPCDLFEDCQQLKDKKADLIVFNHPFFPGEPFSEWPITYTMLDQGSLLRRFLKEASDYCTGPIIMPFYTLAGLTNDPGIQGIEQNYLVVINESFEIRDPAILQKGNVRIFQLKKALERRCDLESCGLAKGSAYESKHWGKVLVREQGPVEYPSDASALLPEIAQSPGKQLEECVFANLAYQLGLHGGRLLAALFIYYREEGQRLGDKIFVLKNCPELEIFQTTYDKQATERGKFAFDATRHILHAFTKKRGESDVTLPILLLFRQSHEKATIEVQDPGNLGNQYQHKVIINYQRLDDGSYRAPEIGGAADGDLQKYFGKDLKEFYRTYLNLMMDYFAAYRSLEQDKNKKVLLWDTRGDRPFTNSFDTFQIMLVPLWVGTRQFPIAVGSMLLFLNSEQHPERQLTYICVASQFLAPVRIQQLTSLTGLHAEKAARAAVIARNMSHNLGSHVLAGLSGDVLTGNGTETERLLAYLQQRMDFVARVATEWPVWREPLFFYRDLLMQFLQQTLVLQRLVRDEGYPIEDIHFCVKGPMDQGPVLFTYHQPQAGTKLASGYIPSREPKDFLVAIPGGSLGKQAIFGFLENALRNAAKHNPKRKNLIVFLGITPLDSQDGSRFWTVTYADNLSTDPNGDVAQSISEVVVSSLTDPYTQRRTEKNWGIHEMRVYAEFLCHPFCGCDGQTLRAESRPSPCASNAEALMQLASASECRGCTEVGDPATASRPTLTYRFSLLRANLLTCLCRQDSGDIHRLRSVGVNTLDLDLQVDHGEDKGHQLAEQIRLQSPAILYVRDIGDAKQAQLFLEWLDDNDLKLPMRVVVNGDLRDLVLNARNPHRFALGERISVQPPTGGADQSAQESFVVRTYWQWLLHFAALRGHRPPFRLLVFFERGSDNRILQQWKNVEKAVRAYGLEKEIYVYLVSNDVGATSPLVPWQVTLAAPSLNEPVQNLARDGTLLLFDNHAKLSKHLSVNTKGYFKFRQVIGKEEDTEINNRVAFDQMANIPEGFPGILSLLQLIESSLLKVLVIDERIRARVCKITVEGGDQSKGLRITSVPGPMLRQLAQGNVYVAPLFLLPKSVVPVGGSAGEVGEVARSAPLFVGDIESWAGVLIDDSSQIQEIRALECSYDATVKAGKPCHPGGPPAFDVAVIHIGQLELLQDRYGVEPEPLLKSLRGFATRVILTSGRGKPRAGTDDSSGPAGAAAFPFVEFSALENFIGREFAKGSLGNVFMSVL